MGKGNGAGLQAGLEPMSTAEALPCSSFSWCPQGKTQDLSNAPWKVPNVLTKAACELLVVVLAGLESPQDSVWGSPAAALHAAA